MDEREKVAIVIKSKAEQSIVDISIFIAGKGFPETALKFKDSLYKFADSLSVFSNKYPFVRIPFLPNVISIVPCFIKTTSLYTK